MAEIRIYVEGGGDRSHGKQKIRTGFGEFLKDLRSQARERRVRWNIIVCGGRSQAFDNFLAALRDHPDAFNVLLVDSEAPVNQGGGPWNHLCSVDSSWGTRNPRVPDEHYHLMAQTMEAWLIADINTLRQYYGRNFNNNALPSTEDVETIPKAQLENGLTAATRNTSKGPYHKIEHGGELLKQIDAGIVQNRAPHCRRLFTVLTQMMEAQS